MDWAGRLTKALSVSAQQPIHDASYVIDNGEGNRRSADASKYHQSTSPGDHDTIIIVFHIQSSAFA